MIIGFTEGDEPVLRVACPDGTVWPEDETDIDTARINASYGDDGSDCACGQTPHVVVRREPIRWTVVPPRVTQTLPAEQVPSCPRCAGRVWLDRTCYRCGGQLPDALGVQP